jgi:TrpR family trp operon transcriptional repressor
MGSNTGRAVNEIAGELAAIGDAVLARRFLESILTPREREEIAGRWELVKLLNRGVSQRHVAERLGMSLCKITRGSRELKKKDSAFKAVLERYERRHRGPEGGRE